jgi:hypothetical protein
MITIAIMTSHKDTKDADDEPTAGHESRPSDSSDVNDWERFTKEHADDLEGIANSSNARKFEKHARRQEKKALMSIDDLSPDFFVAGRRKRDAIDGHGPRDFERSTWLDADDVMDGIDDFTPPNPSLGPINTVHVVFWTMLVAGVALIIAAAFLPRFAGVLGLLGGLSAVIGAAGLVLRHHNSIGKHPGWVDDGSRV